MSFGVNQRPQTGNLPDPFSASFAPVKKTPENEHSQVPLSVTLQNVQASEEVDTSAAASFRPVSSQGDSLTSVMMFPDETTPAASLEKSAEVVRGERILSDLHHRRDPVNGVGGTAKSTDIIVAKIFQQSHLQGDIQQLKQALEKVSTHLRSLDNPEAPPLSRSEIDALNAQLKRFGLMTDGLQLYNLSSRKAAGPGQPRVPCVCSKHELDQLKDVCAAMLAAKPVDNKSLLLGKPQGAESLDKDPLGLSQATDFFAPNAFLPEAFPPANTFSDIVARVDKFDAMLSQAESFLNEGIKVVDGLISEQEQVNKALSDTSKEGEVLIAQVDAQQTEISNILDLKQAVDKLPVETQAITALNKKLAPFGLQIDTNVKGMGRFKHNGASVSETAFKGVIDALLANKTKVLKGLSDQLIVKQNQIAELTEKSQVLSQQIEAAQETWIKPASKAFDNLNRVGNETLEALYGIKNDKDRWSALSSQEQERINALIARQERGLARVHDGAKRGNATLDKVNTALKAADKVRNAAALVFEALGKSSNKLRESLSHLDKLMRDDKKGSAKAQALMDAANALKVKLSSPQSSQTMQQWSEEVLSWIGDVEKRMNADTQRHQQLQAQSRMDQAALDRSLDNLRENLLYHQDQLSSMTETVRERTLNALASALNNFQKLVIKP